MATAGNLGIVGQPSPNISATPSQPNPQIMSIDEIRKEAITFEVAQINYQTFISLMDRLLTQLNPSEQPAVKLTLQAYKALQWQLNGKLAMLKELSRKTELEWVEEQLAIKAAVADLQKTSPEQFATYHLSGDVNDISIDDLKKTHSELFQALCVNGL